MYLFREIVTNPDESEEPNSKSQQLITWQLAGFATKYKNLKPDVYASLGSSFRALDAQILDSNEFQLKFYQKEC